MAAEGKAIIFYHWIFYFVNIDERPAMGSQLNFASRSKVVLVYKCLQKFRGPPPKFGAQKHKISDHVFRDFLTRHWISPEKRRIDK